MILLKSLYASLKYFLESLRYRRFIKKIEKDNEYLFIYAGGPQVGDVVYEFSCIRSFLKQEKKKICVIGDKRFEDMYTSNYAGCYDKLWLLDRKDNLRLIEWTRNNVWKYRFIGLHEQHKFINPYLCSFIDFDFMVGFFEHSWIDAAAKFAFGLNKYEITYPTVAKEDALEKLRMPKGKKRLILVPYANSAHIDIAVFEKIAARYDGKMEIYTNCFGNEKELSGTKRLACSKNDLFNICRDKDTILVGVRCGILDFIASSSDKIVCIYDKKRFAAYCDLREWNSKIINVYYGEGDDFDSLCRSIDESYGH